jgi:hypothetical protein
MTEGFMSFGVILWGTDRPLSSEAIARRFMNQRWKFNQTLPKTKYFIPVLCLAFSVTEDVGYYAWGWEPMETDDNRPSLVAKESLDPTLIEKDSLDDIVETVHRWYSQLANVVIQGP